MLDDLSIQNCSRFVIIRNCLKTKTHNTWHSLFLENVELSGCILCLKMPHFPKVSTMLLILKSKFVITFTKQSMLILFLSTEDHFTLVIFSDLNLQIHNSSSLFFSFALSQNLNSLQCGA